MVPLLQLQFLVPRIARTLCYSDCTARNCFFGPLQPFLSLLQRYRLLQISIFQHRPLGRHQISSCDAMLAFVAFHPLTRQRFDPSSARLPTVSAARCKKTVIKLFRPPDVKALTVRFRQSSYRRTGRAGLACSRLARWNGLCACCTGFASCRFPAGSAPFCTSV